MDVIYRYDPFQPIGHSGIDDADSAIQTLQRGNEDFVAMARQMQEKLFGSSSEPPVVIPKCPLSLGLPLFPGASPLQAPFGLVLGCSDARAPTEAIFDQSFNDLFVVRIAGNVLGTECLGSIDYAVRHLSSSLKVVVVLGHSGCGAVTAAVDAYLTPKNFLDIAFTHPLRSLIDRIQIAVRGAANSLRTIGGEHVEQIENYRDCLIEAAVYLNAAVTAFDLHREVQSLGSTSIRVVYGVYDLVTLRVLALPEERNRPPTLKSSFGDAPQSSEDFVRLATALAERLLKTRDFGTSGEW
ncbi:MAG: carbonic anhydrase [Planctomycetales bacterium]